MTNRFLAHLVRSLPFGICSAILGFSWVNATALRSDGTTQSSGESRGVGSSFLRISNPPLLGPAAGFDLGDACIGSAIARRASALGGVTPYVFSPGTTSSAGNASLSVDGLGRIAGVVSTGPGAGNLSVSVTDAATSVRTGNFFLNTAVFAPGYFAFAMDRLPSAQVGLDYITTIETINASSNTVFSVAGNSVAFDGIAIPNLEFLGLSLFQDGTLAGRPLATGTLTFTARATKDGAVALNRAGTGFDQSLSISIAPGISVQSVFATIGSTIVGSGSKNSMVLQANINPNGLTKASFTNSNFVLRFAGQTYQTALDNKGKARQGNLSVTLRPDSGELKIELTNQDSLALIDPSTLIDKSHVILIAEVEIGSLYAGTEAIQYDVLNRHGRRQLTYRLGESKQLGGLFQITRLQGRDSANGSAFIVNFLISHVKGQSDVPFGNVDAATVRIGPNYLQTVVLNSGVGSFVSAGTGVRGLKIETEHKIGILTTFPLSVADTNAQFAQNPGANTGTFLLGLDITTGTVEFTGECSHQIHSVQPFLP